MIINGFRVFCKSAESLGIDYTQPSSAQHQIMPNYFALAKSEFEPSKDQQSQTLIGKSKTTFTELKATKAEDGSRRIRGLASTPTIDRYSDVVEPEAFRDTMSGFMKNPVVFFNHLWWTAPIGRVTNWEIINTGKGKGLEVEVTLAENAEPADTVWTLIEQKVIKGFSIGFIIKDAKWEKREGRDIYHILKVELLEVSVVSLPANKDTLFVVARDENKGYRVLKGLFGVTPFIDPESHGTPPSEETEQQKELAMAVKELEMREKGLREDVKKQLEQLEAVKAKVKADEHAAKPLLSIEWIKSDSTKCLFCGALGILVTEFAVSEMGETSYVCHECLLPENREKKKAESTKNDKIPEQEKQADNVESELSEEEKEGVKLETQLEEEVEELLGEEIEATIESIVGKTAME